jgi:phenylpyruvate tautomerase PptA (4-oxalocrotonate tautomerase family)
MPMVEVLYVKDEPLSVERKRTFVEKAIKVFREELGTPPARLRLTFQHVEPEDSKVGLIDEVEVGG